MRKIIVLCSLIIFGCNGGSSSETTQSTVSGNNHEQTTTSLNQKVITSIKISHPSISGSSASQISFQSSLQFTATAYYDDDSKLDISHKVDWSSSDNSVTAMDDKGTAKGIKEGVTTIIAQYNGIESNAVELTVTDAVLTGVQIKAKSGDLSALPKGVALSMIATATFSDNSEQELLNNTIWSCNDSSIAMISQSGVLTGINTGTALITAQFNGATSNPIEVTVTDAVVTELLLSAKMDDPQNIPVGFTQSMTVTGIFSDESQQELLSDVTWSSEDTTIATITNSGTITGISEGTTSISAQYNGIESKPFAVTVNDVTLADIKVVPSSDEPISLAKGRELQLTSTGVFSDSSERDISTNVIWSSTNENIVTVNNSGVIHGIEIGNARVNASLNNITAGIEVNVKDAPISFYTSIIKQRHSDHTIKEVEQNGLIAEPDDIKLRYKGDHIDLSVMSVQEYIQAEDTGHDFFIQKDEKGNVIGFAGYASVYRISPEHYYDDSRYITFFSGYSIPNTAQVNKTYKGKIFYTRVAEDDNPKVGNITINLDANNPSCQIDGYTSRKCSSDTSYNGGELVSKVLYSADNSWHGVLHAHFFGENGEHAVGYIQEESTGKVNVFLLNVQ
ncbi:Ig-like domain-containing protein [Photobacterium sp. J15]|uniref:Ig-like domain-containing protein n=1 Tax=Photobacterium sp. J15 TaxID=265901 RepID=UPI0007E48CD1|nr:Ig-like domain-containing protein [Photobacterium sp. J15]